MATNAGTDAAAQAWTIWRERQDDGTSYPVEPPEAFLLGYRLAAAADNTQHYQQLYDAIVAAGRVGTDAGAVYVIPADAWREVMRAHWAALGDLVLW